MDLMAGPVEPHRDPADSPNMRIVKEAFDVLEEAGLEASMEHLLRHAHSDCAFRPYDVAGRVLRSPGEVRAFSREQATTGLTLLPRTLSFQERGDEVVVHGSLRVVRPTAGFAESQVTWTYRFRDGLLQEAGWGPRHPA
jgi:hypothetical protein